MASAVQQTRGSLLRFTLLLTVLSLLFSGCNEKARKRPYGYLRVGSLQEFEKPETYLPDMRFLVRHDERGYSIMSTECSYDLSPLVLKETPEGRFFVSQYTSSKYTYDGRVLAPPSEADLPYYELEIAPGVYGGAPDTLYVKVGTEVSPEWRLSRGS